MRLPLRDTCSPYEADGDSVHDSNISKREPCCVGYGNASDVTIIKSASNKEMFSLKELRLYSESYRRSFDGVCSTDIWVVRAEGRRPRYLYYYGVPYFEDIATQGS